MASAAVVSVSNLLVESIEFPATVKPPASSKIHFLGVAGVRGLEIEGEFVKFTVLGVYLENDAFQHLAVKWKRKSAEELSASDEFYRDIVTYPFEKFTRVTMIRPLTGAEFSEKVMEHCATYLKSVGIYTDSEAKAVEKFLQVFKEEIFPPSASVLWTQLTNGSLADHSDIQMIVIENKQLSEAILESGIGKSAVSPAATGRLAARMALLTLLDGSRSLVSLFSIYVHA